MHPRSTSPGTRAPYRRALLQDQPLAYWPLNDLTGPPAQPR